MENQYQTSVAWQWIPTEVGRSNCMYESGQQVWDFASCMMDDCSVFSSHKKHGWLHVVATLSPLPLL